MVDGCTERALTLRVEHLLETSLPPDAQAVEWFLLTTWDLIRVALIGGWHGAGGAGAQCASPWTCAPRAPRMARTSTPPAAALSDSAARIFRSEEELAALPASERIRYRVIKAKRRFHANDNIAAFVRDGELAELKAEEIGRAHV